MKQVIRFSYRKLYFQKRCLSTDDILALDMKHVIHPYTSMTNRMPCLPVKSAHGVHIELEDGSMLIDGMSSWWAAVHGYCHPVLDRAIATQSQLTSHVMFGGLTHRPAVELCKLLVDITPSALDKVFLCDSGSISVEVALKMATQYWYATGSPNKTKFISLTHGYHGDTFGAMSVCDPVNSMHSMFKGVLAANFFVPSPENSTVSAAERSLQQLEIMLQQHHSEITAMIVEPVVQGAGGMRFYSPYFLQQARKLCDRYDVLLIFDEIATGFGRTGAMFALEHSHNSFKDMFWSSSKEKDDHKDTFAVVPDILCLGKALTGGYMTLGATMCTSRISEGISSNQGVFMHGPTFMGNPLACAVACAAVDLLISSPWHTRVSRVNQRLIEGLKPLGEHDKVKEVRVLGAIGVCELKEPVKDLSLVQKILLQEGVWLRPFGKLIYTMPTFNCDQLTDNHVDRITGTIRKLVQVC